MAFKIILALYLVVAVAMILFILMQRGAGAQAGSGFGAGASGTVFGASGAANFLSISTKWLAVAFFAISIGMGVYVSHSTIRSPATDLGVMANEAATDTAANSDEVPAPTLPANPEVPAAQAPTLDTQVPVAVDTAVAPPAAETETEVEKSDKP